MAQRGVALKGRAIVGLILAGFVFVALAIVWRRTIGISKSRSVVELQDQRVQLQGERARLEAEIRAASTRERLGTIVERDLGMHIPSESQVVILPRPAERGNNP